MVPPPLKTQPSAASPRRLVLPAGRGRDTLLAVAAGACVLGFIFYAVFSLSRQAASTGGMEGEIIAKEFVARPETQITFGQEGLRSRAIAGEYSFRLRVARESGRVYKLLVDPATYASHAQGETFYFLRPPDRAPGNP